ARACSRGRRSWSWLADSRRAAALTRRGFILGLAPPPTRREQLAEFLRHRREHTRPESVGLSADGRRRTPGLRREEVSQLAGSACPGTRGSSRAATSRPRRASSTRSRA